MRRHEPFVRSVVQHRIETSDVDDLVQKVFVAVWRTQNDSRAIIDAPKDTQRRWLRTAAVLEVAAFRRATGRRQRLRRRLHSLADRNPVRSDPVGQPVEAVRRSLARLRPHDREIIEAAHFDGLSSEELGQWLGCSPEAARQRLSRAMHRLRPIYAREVQR